MQLAVLYAYGLYYTSRISTTRKRYIMNSYSKGFIPLIMVGVATATLASGVGLVYASNGSKPGDVLYSIDRGAENIQLALAFTNNGQKDLRATLASERLTEIKALYDAKDTDEAHIIDAQTNYNEHHAELVKLSDEDGVLDSHEENIENSLEQEKSNIDKLAEGNQSKLEAQKEDLSKQYEKALKDGDTSKASTLKDQINSSEQQLKVIEAHRETEKKGVEVRSQEQEQEQDTQDQKSAEETSRDVEQKNETETKTGNNL